MHLKFEKDIEEIKEKLDLFRESDVMEDESSPDIYYSLIQSIISEYLNSDDSKKTQADVEGVLLKNVDSNEENSFSQSEMSSNLPFLLDSKYRDLPPTVLLDRQLLKVGTETSKKEDYNED